MRSPGFASSATACSKCGGRDGGGVGVDEADAAVATSEKVFGGGEKALAEAFAPLRDEREVCREEVVEEGFVADRRVGDNASGFAGCSDGGYVFGGVLEEADVDGCGLIEGKRWGKPCFDLARTRRLCHNGESALGRTRGDGVRGIEYRIWHRGSRH